METIINVLNGLRRQWGEVYVISQETTKTITEIQTHLDKIAAQAKWLNLSLVCSWVAFSLSVLALVYLLIQRRKDK